MERLLVKESCQTVERKSGKHKSPDNSLLLRRVLQPRLVYLPATDHETKQDQVIEHQHNKTDRKNSRVLHATISKHVCTIAFAIPFNN